MSGRLAFTRQAVRRRRRNILFGLVAVMAVTLLGALLGVGAGLSLQLHLAADVLFLAYLAMLVRARQQAAERELKVHYLPTSLDAPPPGPPEPDLVLARQAVR